MLCSRQWPKLEHGMGSQLLRSVSVLQQLGEEPLLTIEDVCVWLSICESTLSRLRREKKLLPAIDDGVVRFRPSDVRALLAKSSEK